MSVFVENGGILWLGIKHMPQNTPFALTPTKYGDRKAS